MKNARCLKFLFIALDVACICAAVVVSYLLRFDYPDPFLYLNSLVWNILLWSIGITTVFYVLELYTFFGFRKIFARIFFGILIIGAFFSVISFIFLSFFVGRGLFALQAGAILTSTTLWRVIYNYFQHQIEKPISLYLHCPEYIRKKITDDLKREKRVLLKAIYNYQSVTQLPTTESLKEHDNTMVLFMDDPEMPDNIMQHLIQCRFMGIPVKEIVDFYEEMLDKIPVYHLSNRWFVCSYGFSAIHHTFYQRLKRLADIGLSLALLIFSSPVIFLTAIAIKLDSNGPVFYRQQRVGLNKDIFTLYKFRSMTPDAERNGAVWAQNNDARITRIGKLIRRLRIDELPQLFNVLKGEMSFIGPRPERPEFIKELEKEIPYYSYRHLVKPGITGWAQVNYRYGASLEDAVRKLEYDLYYIKNAYLLLDLQIILKTIRVVVFRMGSR